MWTAHRPRLSTGSMMSSQLRHPALEEGEEEETTQLLEEEEVVVEVQPDVHRPDMELLENDCSNLLPYVTLTMAGW